MASKNGGLLATLGKRLLGFNTSACCATPTAEAAKVSDTKPVEMLTPVASEEAGGCCAPSCCQSEAPASTRNA